MATNRNGLTGHDIRAGVQMADGVMKDVATDVRTLAQEARPKFLEGSDREEFFNHMSQEEWDTLHAVGTALGPKGENKLEMLLKEMIAMKNGGD